MICLARPAVTSEEETWKKGDRDKCTCMLAVMLWSMLVVLNIEWY